MKNRERFVHAMNFESVDRYPMIEWAGWWDKTILRWKEEGLPRNLSEEGEIREHLGLDKVRQCWIRATKDTCPVAKSHGSGILSDGEDYLRVKEHLYPEEVFDRDTVTQWSLEQQKGDMVVWITLEGFFWFPRTLLGIQKHLYAFYDLPELMHEMNQDVLAHNLRALDQFCEVCVPDFMTFAEDMSYNHGPMISKPLFDEFMGPYYRQVVPRLKEYDIIPFVDTDGNIESMVSWFTEVGVEGFLPLERQSGIDLLRLRGEHPGLKLIGGYDKMVMCQGEVAMRAEFERILPVMRQGGYVPGVDHQTPPEVSLENYGIYLRLLEEYCRKAA
ncbi:MAG: uroporphyrinogen decarboxylase family protein [Candidatus Latescibacterota bacterium]